MLSNPKHDPFSLESLAGYLETKDPTERYDFSNPFVCGLAQYFTERLGQPVHVNTHEVYNTSTDAGTNGGSRKLPDHFNAIILGDTSVASTKNWTFGAALDRARKVLAKQYA